MTPSNSTPSKEGQSGRPGQHRTLSDDVLQSAEDAVASEGADDYAGVFRGDSRGDYVARTGGVQSPYTGTVGSAGPSRLNLGMSQGAGFFSRMEDQVTSYVARQPARAAMMAAGAGALLALVMGRRKMGRRGKV